MNVETILIRKGATVVTATPGTSVAEAAALMRQKNVGSVVVSRTGRDVEGIVSEREIVHALAEHGAGLLAMPVSAVMAKWGFTCTFEDGLADLAQMMTDRRMRHVPVVENGVLRGIVSIGDVVKNRLDECEFEAISLREYIVGT